MIHLWNHQTCIRLLLKKPNFYEIDGDLKIDEISSKIDKFYLFKTLTLK